MYINYTTILGLRNNNVLYLKRVIQLHLRAIDQGFPLTSVIAFDAMTSIPLTALKEE